MARLALKTFVPRKFLIGLRAYTSQIALSIDRSLGDLEGMRRYCKSSELVNPGEVIAALNHLVPVKCEVAIKYDHDYDTPSVPVRIFQWFLSRGCWFRTCDLLHILRLLEMFSGQMERGDAMDKEELVLIRTSLSYASAALSERIMFAQRRRRTGRVRHLNQNPRLTSESLQSICDGNVWP